MSILQDDLSNEGLTTSMKEALRLNATAVSMSIFVGAPTEKETLLNLGKLVDEGEEYGVPVVAITAVGTELEKRDDRYLSLACRIAAEVGAHMVKTYYCEGFTRVVDGCPVPLVVAGGPEAQHRDGCLPPRPQRHPGGSGGGRHGAQHMAERQPGRDDKGSERDSP